MRLTPLDIRKQEFKKGMRGLDADEVYAFLATIADEYEAVLNDNKALRERLLELDDKVQEYRNMEKTLRDTLLTAERITVDAKDAARREAELIIKQAELDADKGVRDIKANAMKLRQEIKSLKSQRESYMARMKMLVETHLKFLESAESDFEEDDRMLDVGKTDKPLSNTTTTPTSKPIDPPRSAARSVEEPRRSPAAGAPPERDSGASMSPPLDTPVTPGGDRPLPDGPTPRPTQSARPEAVSRSSVATAPDPSPEERLNELLSRVAERTAPRAEEETPSKAAPPVTETLPKPPIAQPERPEALEPNTKTLPTGPAPRKSPPDVDSLTVSASPLLHDEADEDVESETPAPNPSEWSLERLKQDILARRAKADETSD